MSLGPLSYLANFRQFIVVMLAPLANGKTNKLPVRYDTLAVCDAQAPENWTDYATAATIVDKLGSGWGLGFVLGDADDLFCIDIDSCATPNGWSEVARAVCHALPGCVIEVSQSGRGIHIWGRRSQMPLHASKNVNLGLECYSRKRFILLGSQAVGAMAEDCPQVDLVVAGYFPPREAAPASETFDGPCPEWRGPTDDADLLRRALQSKSAAGVFGGRASFADLWHAEETVLNRAYPPDSGSSEPYDRSSADLALASHLAFWCGKDVPRIERLMRQSALARDKYDRPDYLVGRTIKAACAGTKQVLQDKPSAVPEPAVAPVAAAAAAACEPQGMTAVEGRTFLDPQEQAKLFAGCVYVLDEHKVLVPGGHLLNPERFRARFGGYSFSMGGDNSRVVRNAFEAFTESQALRAPQVDGTCFRPDLPFGTVVLDAGRRRVNKYWPVEVPCTPGDVTPFLNHVALLFPNVHDRRVALAYMAAIVQYPGVKFQWALLIQGVEGNGKTYLSRCVAEAVGRKYTYWPKAKKVAAQFNSWLYGHIFFAVEDIHTGADSDILDDIKPMITGGDGLEIEAKGVDQTTREICGNFIFNSNHKNAIKKTANDRRFAVLFCAQQDAVDLIRDGMGGEYMHDLYEWSKAGGYAAVTHYLKNYPIPDELNPATKCQRAPTTSSTAEAIAQSLGVAEQQVVEAIEQGEVGFMDGWVSSVALDRLLERIGKGRSVSLNRRREMMRALGYDWHPALLGGRVNNIVLPDGAKPRLYIRHDHVARTLTVPADVARAYTLAQGVTTPPPKP